MKDSNKSNKKKSKKEKIKIPDYLGDAVDAVELYDDVRLGRKEIKGESAESLHKKAVKLILLCNGVKGKGHISISKARCILQSLRYEAKLKDIMDNLKCTRDEAEAKHKQNKLRAA